MRRSPVVLSKIIHPDKLSRIQGRAGMYLISVSYTAATHPDTCTNLSSGSSKTWTTFGKLTTKSKPYYWSQLGRK